MRIDEGLRRPPQLAARGHVGPILLGRAQGFYGMARPLSPDAIMAFGMRRRGPMTKTPIAVLGIDLGKNSCSLAGMDASGAVVMRKRMTRDAIVTFATALPACVIAVEACCGAHFLGRTLALYGHTIRLMSPEYVQPYVKAQKTDDRDAEAIAEAATRPTMRFVSLKSEDQLDLQTLHRVRERLVNARTALINQLRAVLLERGIVLPKGRINLMRRLEDLMAGDPAVSARTARCWPTCAPSGRGSTSGSRRMTTNSPR